ncbi:HNH endonuclease signature motif containing protein [Bacillus cereus group sp. BfR-BA-01522]|uniref:HNH endonuclease signature motif containing protein n=1 Tax=Bacillus cereus group sp. BfR-BA-01522 TaxID=2920370 RepID=UPI0037C188DF
MSYEMLKGPIEEGMVIDHLCRNRKCVNPLHLEQVTQRINLLRGEGMSAENVKKTHCPQGHEYTEENTYISKAGSRYCRKCRAMYSNRSYWRKKGQRRKGILI